MAPDRPRLGDPDVDAIRVMWDDESEYFLVRVEVPEEAGFAGRVLANFATVLAWDDVAMLAAGVVNHAARSTDLGGYSYDMAPHGDVVVYDGGDHEVQVSGPAFHRFMARWLDALIAGGETATDPAMAAPWWPQLRATADAIRALATS